ncbi:hypothetical protein [Parachryseolinea silvisoli]|jgi:hypothetical protein|uniref:hypothetical protein n=1 Tax=Parachryseolinea silvisoli TaxID=2873601 RepID=UPI002265AB63|nr:hypothetical protein [Parachryseolinea silvisoli]MCD9014406.1 hypothetical protein [Parachryseolinea silvisoli]
MRVIAILAFVSLSYCTNAQTFSLDDILNARAMDSTELRTFSHDKGFELREVEIDSWRSVHKYYSSDSTICFERTFPTGRKLFSENTTTKYAGMVYYHFSDKAAVKEFQREMKEKGFKFKRTESKDYGANFFTHNIFVTKDDEIDLATEKLGKENIKYTLMYYQRRN